jgi:hypothetical protein
VVFFPALLNGLLPLRGEGGNRLEPPFLVRHALQGLIAIVRDLLLPVQDGFLVLFPGGPRLVRFDGGFVEVGAILDRLFVQLLAVDERPSRGDGQQEEAHAAEGLDCSTTR